MGRQVGDWIDGFIELMEVSGAPTRLRQWTAIAGIAGALERKTWVYTAGATLYPNLYTFLVAPPGVGKSRPLAEIRNMWAELEDHKIAASSVSKASVIDELNDAHRTIIRAGEIPSTVEFHSLKVMAGELGVFLSEYASDFINTLTDLYDGYHFEEKKRTKSLHIKIPKPQINLLAGTTPDYLSNLLPAGAWDQGFLSRTILIYESKKTLTSLFADTKVDQALRTKLIKDLQHIGSLYGEMKFTPDAAQFIDEWYLKGQAPMPNHPKLRHYCTRRITHILKLSQVASVLENDELVITVDNIRRAMGWLFDAEAAMPDIFKEMNSGGDGKVMEEAWHMLFLWVAKYKTGAPEAALAKFLSSRVPAYSVERIIQMMEKSGMLKIEAVKGKGMLYFPKEKNAFE